MLELYVERLTTELKAVRASHEFSVTSGIYIRDLPGYAKEVGVIDGLRIALEAVQHTYDQLEKEDDVEV